MVAKLLSFEFIFPLICFLSLFFFSSRLYSLRNMSLGKLNAQFNIAFVFGKIAYSLMVFLVLAYLIVNFISGNYLMPLIVVALSVILSLFIARKVRLGVTTEIPYPIMTLNCIMNTLSFVALLIYLFYI